MREGIDGVTAMCVNADNVNHAALFALQGMLGMRVTEARSIRPSSFNLNQMSVNVRGKGDAERDVPVPATAWKYIAPAFQQALQDDSFLVDLSDRGARLAITRTAERLGFAERVKSHDLRATFATEFLLATKDLRSTQHILGHRSSKTTEIYTKPSAEAMREDMEKVYG